MSAPRPDGLYSHSNPETDRPTTPPRTLRTVGRGALPSLAPPSSSDPARINTPLLPPGPQAAGLTCGLLTALTGAEAGGSWVVGPHGLVVGRSRAANVVVESSAVSRSHARFGAAPNGAFFVEDLGSTNGTFVWQQRVSCSPLTSGDLVRLGPDFRLRFSLVDESEASLRCQMYESAVRDPLTGTFNRRYFLQRLGAELNHAERISGDLAMLMIDVDDLKGLNDRLGHLAGDLALRALAHAAVSAVRSGDVVARYGGDEFAVLAPGADLAQGIFLADRIRTTMERLRFSASGAEVELSASIGVGSLGQLGRTGCGLVDLVAFADRRLYDAKRARPGRERVDSNRPNTRWGAPGGANETTEIRQRAPSAPPPPRGA